MIDDLLGAYPFEAGTYRYTASEVEQLSPSPYLRTLLTSIGVPMGDRILPMCSYQPVSSSIHERQSVRYWCFAADRLVPDSHLGIRNGIESVWLVDNLLSPVYLSKDLETLIRLVCIWFGFGPYERGQTTRGTRSLIRAMFDKVDPAASDNGSFWSFQFEFAEAEWDSL